MIEFEVATKYFGSTAALDEVSFVALPGEVTALLGPNGAGKTTLFRCLLGLDRLDAGTALFDGVSFTEMYEPAKHVGVMLDSRHGNPNRTGYQHLRAKSILLGLTKAHVWQALESVGLSDSGHKRIGRYSLGMKQRLAIAYALLSNPETVIFDEPLNGLDSDGIRWVRELTRGLADEGKTVLLASHFMTEVESTADRIVVLDNGQVLADSDTGDLLLPLGVKVAALDTDALIRTLESNRIEFETSNKGVICYGIEAELLGHLAHDTGLTLSHLSAVNEGLEQAFLRLIAKSQSSAPSPDGK